MQQGAVPWLHRVVLHNGTEQPLADLRVTIDLQPGLTSTLTVHVAAVPAGASYELPRLDPQLDVVVLANLLERQRANLVLRVWQGDRELASHESPLAVLASHEWPGLVVMPALLGAFVQPNHPALASVLRAAAAKLQQATGRSALDGYQTHDPQRALAQVAALYDAVAALGITYINPPPSFEQHGQKVRGPEQVCGDRLATCLDLALLFAALLEQVGLAAVLVLERGHAFVGARLRPGSESAAEFGSAVELRKRADVQELVVFECTGVCGGAMPFGRACSVARERLDNAAEFVVALDLVAVRRLGIQPLPSRTQAYAVAVEELPADAVAGVAHDSWPTAAPLVESPEDGADAPELPPGQDANTGPKDRLEHWRSRLLDLSMWNRLLNFTPTKKSVRLCAHDPAALEDRLQQTGRLRVLPRPPLGTDQGDPRDLALQRERTGKDAVAEFLASELQRGRLHAEHEAEDLDARLVEIFRHARTSLEETGANTLYLAIGFLRYYETPQSQQVRRAPLLLLPLVIERLSVQEGFRFVLDDGEPRLNHTLLQLLARDFGLRVALGDTPPEDEQGVDVAAVLAAFRQAVLKMPRWEVESTACIGFFSFTKYLMWLDLADRERLLASPVLQHLIERPGSAYPQTVVEVPREELDDLAADSVLCPKDADSSQLAAVLAGAAGRTFVLEGPPGTGKSQTITNLIAQSLAQGQRVLFVAEKRAALEVVQRRLAEVGLGPFCLELHSSKSGPKAVLEQLRRALELGARRDPAGWQQTAADLQLQRQQLNDLVRALHRPRSHGWSVHAAMGQLMGLRDARRLERSGWGVLAPAAVQALQQAVGQLAGVAASMAAPMHEPWWGVRLHDWTPALQREVVPVAQRLQTATTALQQALAQVSAPLGLDRLWGAAGASRHQLELALELAAMFRRSQLPPPALLLAADWRSTAAALAARVELGQQRDRRWQALAERWRPELLQLELAPLVAAVAAAWAGSALLRWWRLRAPRQTLAVAAADPAALHGPRLLDDLREAQQVQAESAALQAAADCLTWFGKQAEDWAAIQAAAEWVAAVRALVLRLQPGALQPDAQVLAAMAAAITAANDPHAAVGGNLGALQQAFEEWQAARRAAQQWLQLDEDAAYGSAQTAGCLDQVLQRCAKWLAAVPRLREQCAYQRAATAVGEAGGELLVALHARGELAADQLPAAFLRTWLEDWLDQIHAAEPQLAAFRGPDHERAIARFAALDRQCIRLAAEVVIARLAAQLPAVRDTQVASSELGLLVRELKKQRRHLPVRRLLAQIPGLLGRLSPCMLMSPLSVAQFLGGTNTQFDLVVFDEASQIPVWDAVGTMGRGRALVCVGDSRQLPPTSFFQRMQQGDEPGPDELPEDLESVLDECVAAGLPRMHLDWHYRSRHESLITFSNAHYYENRLLTFPAPQAEAVELGLRLVWVGGTYDRAGSRQNRAEAEALVAEVLRRLLDPQRASRSLGIVTFSQPQQVLIEDLLDRARVTHPAIEPWFTTAAEPVFVKNLENVQGDERDTILFSICYGPDAAGKIYENYGPLNLQGGERRLNVAITRARSELLVFTSLRAEQIANRTAAIGARHLRSFLDFAQRGAVALPAATTLDPGRGAESPFEAAVLVALRQRGHEVHSQVGCSGYRIDLAVVDPRAPGRYLLGVECDGATYHAAATARDRDRLRSAVLVNLGWRLHRIWSTDFWQDPQGELDRVEAAIAAAMAAAVAPVAAPSAAPEPVVAAPAAVTELAAGAEPTLQEVPAAPAVTDPDGPREFADAEPEPVGDAERFADPAATALVRAQVLRCLQQEAPVVFDRLARAVAASFGLARVTERVRERIRELLPAGVVERDAALWPDAAAADSFAGFRVPSPGAAARRAEELPRIEVANAMAWLLRQHQALAADDLAREAARCFGITRLGTVVRAVMATGLEDLVQSGRAERDGELLRLPPVAGR